jgi:hypothetical protein
MITQAADLAGMVRLPAGVSATDVAAALRQLDESLLFELFDRSTADFIIADLANPPATTLQAGAGGLGRRWGELGRAWAASSLHFAVAGSGVQTQANKNFSSALAAHLAWAAATAEVESMRERLQAVARTYWAGEATVTNVLSATFLELSLPTQAWQWLRVGSALAVRGQDGQVVALPAPGTVQVQVASTAGFVVGSTVYYQIKLKLRAYDREI